jgi:hypothetical protein
MQNLRHMSRSFQPHDDGAGNVVELFRPAGR